METTIRLQQRGWKTAYHRETLAYGLAPGAAGAYHVQRMRWGQGAMQVLRKLKPLTIKGLTLQQRLAYFAGTACYFEGWQKAVFYLMPLFFFYTGILPVAGSETAFLSRLVPYILLCIVSFELLSRGTGYLILSERFTMVRVWTYMMAALAIFTRRPLKFNVTPKGHSSVPRMAYMPQLVLFLLSIFAPIWATIAYTQGIIYYDAAGWHSLAFWVNAFWALWNCYFAWHVVKHSLAMKQQRDDHRFADQMAIEVRAANAQGALAIPAMTADLNPTGLGFRATQRVEPGTKVTLELPIAPAPITVTGEVRHVQSEMSHLALVYMHGVEFGDMPIEVRDAIELHCTQHAMPAWRQKYRQSIDILTRAGEIVRNLRGQRRRLAGLPARLTVGDVRGTTTGRMMILEEMSEGGARVIGAEPISPGTPVTFEVPGASVRGAGVVRHVQMLPTLTNTLFSMGIQLDGQRPSRSWRTLLSRTRQVPPNGSAAQAYVS